MNFDTDIQDIIDNLCLINNKYDNILYFNIVLYIYMIEFSNPLIIDPENENKLYEILDQIKLKYLLTLQK